jgi:hypothetical protein
MTLGNMREQDVRHLIAYCLNDASGHQALIDVSSYPGDTEVPWFGGKVVCAKCGARGRRIDVRPNWKEAPGTIDDWSGLPAWEKLLTEQEYAEIIRARVDQELAETKAVEAHYII